jgi:cell surface protein SprA
MGDQPKGEVRPVTRDIVAFADLGERRVIHNPLWEPSGSEHLAGTTGPTPYTISWSPSTRAHGSYPRATSSSPGSWWRECDYEKLGNARLLDPSEYTIQRQLGYITLRLPLQPDEVLAVAYEFTVERAGVPGR